MKRGIVSTFEPFTLNEHSPQAAGLVGVWMPARSPNQSPLRDMRGSNHATLTNVAWAGDGRFGAVASLNGTSSRGLGTTVNLGSAFTVCCWSYRTAAASGSPYESHMVSGDSYPNGLINLQYGYGASSSNKDKLRFIVCTNSPNAYQDLQSATNRNLNQWYHVVGVCDGANQYLYVDGALDVSRSIASGTVVSVYPIEFGSLLGLSGRWFAGYLTDMRWYNRAMQANEVMAMYTNWRDLYMPVKRRRQGKAALFAVSRRTFSPLGARIGARQVNT